MIARDLAEPYPHVMTNDAAVDAVRLVAEQNLPALLVLDADGTPYAVVPGSQLVRQLVPEYVMEDPLLAAVIDDRHADALADELVGKTVAQWIPGRSFKPAVRRPRGRNPADRGAHGPYPRTAGGRHRPRQRRTPTSRGGLGRFFDAPSPRCGRAGVSGWQSWAAVAVFAGVYLLIITEWVHRVAAALGARR